MTALLVVGKKQIQSKRPSPRADSQHGTYLPTEQNGIQLIKRNRQLTYVAT